MNEVLHTTNHQVNKEIGYSQYRVSQQAGNLPNIRGELVMGERREHLGQLIARLRAERRMSQQELANEAGLALSTVAAIESRSEFSGRAGTMIRVLQALDVGPMPIRDSDWDLALKLTGLDAVIRTATAPARRPDIRSSLEAQAHRTPERATAHQWVDELMDAVGVPKVLDVLQGLADFAGVELSAAITEEEKSHRRSRTG